MRKKQQLLPYVVLTMASIEVIRFLIHRKRVHIPTKEK